MSKKTMTTEQVARMWQIQQELKGLCTIWHGLQACALDVVEELENDFLEEGFELSPEVHRGFALMQKLLLAVGVTPALEIGVR